MIRSLEVGRGHAPASSLYTCHRYDRSLLRGRQDRKVQNAVLFCTNEFLTIKKQYGNIRHVLKTQFRNSPTLMNLGDVA